MKRSLLFTNIVISLIFLSSTALCQESTQDSNTESDSPDLSDVAASQDLNRQVTVTAPKGVKIVDGDNHENGTLVPGEYLVKAGDLFNFLKKEVLPNIDFSKIQIPKIETPNTEGGAAEPPVYEGPKVYAANPYAEKSNPQPILSCTNYVNAVKLASPKLPPNPLPPPLLPPQTASVTLINKITKKKFRVTPQELAKMKISPDQFQIIRDADNRCGPTFVKESPKENSCALNRSVPKTFPDEEMKALLRDQILQYENSVTTKNTISTLETMIKTREKNPFIPQNASDGTVYPPFSPSQPTGCCSAYVSRALNIGGLVPPGLTRPKACQMKTALIANGFINILGLSDGKTTYTSPKSAPKGAILVYDDVVKENYGFGNGHIEVKTGSSGEPGYDSDYATPCAPKPTRKLVAILIKSSHANPKPEADDHDPCCRKGTKPADKTLLASLPQCEQ